MTVVTRLHERIAEDRAAMLEAWADQRLTPEETATLLRGFDMAVNRAVVGLLSGDWR
jgi:hypothetical protein